MKSRVWLPSPKITGGIPFVSLLTNLGITSALVPEECSRGPYALKGRTTVTGRP